MIESNNILGLNEMDSFGTCEAIKDTKRIYINHITQMQEYAKKSISMMY